ncbi:hypothetical protein B0H13DRAFT_1877189 [Mycena leptocephala]|nr:hypothetical protein B0H13DRAFT_1877189 [Mycena leptocephala]
MFAPNLTLVDDEVPQVVGKFIPRLLCAWSHQDLRLNQGMRKPSVSYWIIKPHGDGQAIIPVPKDGSNTVMYLTASGFVITVAVTVSPFPVSWPSLTGSTVPPGLTEEWTAQICWPHSNNNVPRLLDLYAGNPAPDTNVRFSVCHITQLTYAQAVLYPYGATQQQFWRIQFLQYQSTAIETGLSAYCCLIDVI